MCRKRSAGSSWPKATRPAHTYIQSGRPTSLLANVQYLGRLDPHSDGNLVRKAFSLSKSCASRRPRTYKAEARRDARRVEHLIVDGHLVLPKQALLQRGSEAVKAKVCDE